MRRAGTHLSVPPPAKQRSVRNPCVEFVFVEEIEVGAYHMSEGLGAFGVTHGLLKEARVVMAEDVIATRFMEIFVFGRSIQMVIQPKRVGEGRIMVGIGVNVGWTPASIRTGQRRCGGPKGETGCEHPPHRERSRFAQKTNAIREHNPVRMLELNMRLIDLKLVAGITVREDLSISRSSYCFMPMTCLVDWKC